MRTLLPVLLAGGVLLGWGNRARAQDDVRAVIQKAVRAHGGEDVLNRFKAGRIRYRGTIEVFKGVPFTEEMTYQEPNKFRQVTELEADGQRSSATLVFNGEKGWHELNGKDLPVDDKLLTELKEVGHLMRVSRLVALLDDRAYQLSPLAEAQVNGRAAAGVRVECKGLRDVRLFFDKENGLLVKTERRALSPPNPKEFTEERIVTEYQKVDGVQTPKKLLVNRDGKKYMEAEVVEVKLLEKVDPRTFALPR